MALFVRLIIRTFQPVFSAGTVFFSHNRLVSNTFSHGFSAKRMSSILVRLAGLAKMIRPLIEKKTCFYVRVSLATYLSRSI
jgi:hypothetical protein